MIKRDPRLDVDDEFAYPPDTLGMDAEEMRRLGHKVVDMVVDRLQRKNSEPAIVTGTPAELQETLGGRRVGGGVRCGVVAHRVVPGPRLQHFECRVRPAPAPRVIEEAAFVQQCADLARKIQMKLALISASQADRASPVLPDGRG